MTIVEGRRISKQAECPALKYTSVLISVPDVMESDGVETFWCRLSNKKGGPLSLYVFLHIGSIIA